MLTRTGAFPRLNTALVKDLPIALPDETGDHGESHSRRALYLSVKITLEWFTALLLMLIAGPIILALAALVKLTSPGPAFYSQTRLGRNGRLYKLHKLRTMVANAEAATGPVWAAKNDSRITPLGNVLRNTHLDELPQLWNVLCGDMCLIGPRPERPEIAGRIERELPAYRDRLQVYPGITGLAQMLVPADDPNLPLAVSAGRKLAHDLFYVREVSPLLDLRIAIATPCYFLAAAVEAVRRRMVHSYGLSVAKEFALAEPDSGPLTASPIAASAG